MSEQIKIFFTNYLLMSALVSWFGAQIVKVFTGMFKERKFDLKRFYSQQAVCPALTRRSFAGLQQVV